MQQLCRLPQPILPRLSLAQDNIDRMAREFGLVSEAWQVLSKPSLRSKYVSPCKPPADLCH